MKPTKPYYENNSNLEDKLNTQPEDKHEDLKRLLDTSEFYKNCMYCGNIYEGDYEKVVYKNGVSSLGREFEDYSISTGVCKLPSCIDKFQKQLDDLKRYKLEK